MEGSRDVVREMWTAYREAGVEGALHLLDEEVEFVAADGTVHRGHAGVRRFFDGFTAQGQVFEASPYSFEGQGDAVLVAGHRRIHSAEGTEGAYLYFAHLVRGGLIVRLAAYGSREAALADLRSASDRRRR